MNRVADLVAEGFDLAVRSGELSDTSMIARTVGSISQRTVASPAYLARRSPSPETPADLNAHDCLIYTLTDPAGRWPFRIEGTNRTIKVDGIFTANDTLCQKSVAVEGQGIARLPALYVKSEINRGTLVDVLPIYEPEPIPVHLVFPSRQLMNRTVRPLINFISENLSRKPINQTL